MRGCKIKAQHFVNQRDLHFVPPKNGELKHITN